MLLVPGLSSAQTAPGGLTDGGQGVGVQAPSAPSTGGVNVQAPSAPSTGSAGQTAGQANQAANQAAGQANDAANQATGQQGAPANNAGQTLPNIGNVGQNVPNIGNAGQTLPNTNNAGQNLPSTNNAGQNLPNTSNVGQNLPSTNNAGQTLPNTSNVGQGVPNTAGTMDLTNQPSNLGNQQIPGVPNANPGQVLQNPGNAMNALPNQAGATGIDGSMNAAGSLTFGGNLTLGGTQFNSGEAFQVVQLPSGFTLPNTGAVTIPEGSIINVPGRPDLGNINVTSPLNAQVGVNQTSQLGANVQNGVQQPGIPSVNAPGMPDANAVQNLPNVSGLQNLLQGINMPDATGVPNVGVPGVPGIENNVGLPGVPGMENNAGLPGVPSTGIGQPSIPSLGSTDLGSIQLSSGINLGDAQLPAGQQLQIISLPEGFTLPDTGLVSLPAGSLVSVPGQPDLGILSVDAPFSAQISGGFNQGFGAGVPMSSIQLSAPFLLGGELFPAGQELQVFGVPQGFTLPQSGSVVLPQGSVVFAPNRPDLGNMTVGSPVTGDVRGVQGIGQMAPNPSSVAGVQVGPSGVAGITGVSPAVNQPTAAQLQVRQVPRTGGESLPLIAFGLSLLAGSGLALRALGRKI